MGHRETNIATEIERKFLVKLDFKPYATGCFSIKQGYLSSEPERSVRIRITDDKGFLTIKGKSDETGTSRLEWEKEIPLDEAEALFNICEKGTIEKTRYIIEHDDLIFEVDEFYGNNKGLIIAEVELPEINTEINLPHWIGKEVTNDTRYYNSQLIKNPYLQWGNNK